MRGKATEHGQCRWGSEKSHQLGVFTISKDSNSLSIKQPIGRSNRNKSAHVSLKIHYTD